MPDPNAESARILEQEHRLQLATVPPDLAWQIGTRLRMMAEQRGAFLAIEVRIARETLFFCAMPGTTPSNADWARRKRNTVELLHRSSYRVGLELAREDTTLEAKLGLPLRDYASHGGAFPLAVQGMGAIGCVTVSGLPQREDHALVVEALAGLCGVPPDDIALAP